MANPYLKKCENQNDWLHYWSGRGKKNEKNIYRLDYWPDQPDRLLRPCVYARGSKRSHQSALECVTVMDSTSHSKIPQCANMRR